MSSTKLCRKRLSPEKAADYEHCAGVDRSDVMEVGRQTLFRLRWQRWKYVQIILNFLFKMLIVIIFLQRNKQYLQFRKNIL